MLYIGARVKLDPNHSEDAARWVRRQSHGHVGTVIGHRFVSTRAGDRITVGFDVDWIRVRWDNDYVDNYKCDALIIVEQKDLAHLYNAIVYTSLYTSIFSDEDQY